MEKPCGWLSVRVCDGERETSHSQEKSFHMGIPHSNELVLKNLPSNEASKYGFQFRTVQTARLTRHPLASNGFYGVVHCLNRAYVVSQTVWRAIKMDERMLCSRKRPILKPNPFLKSGPGLYSYDSGLQSLVHYLDSTD